MELVAAVGQRLAARPADRGQLRRRQRLGHQRVVVDRHDVAPDRADERRERVRGEDHAPRPHPAALRAQQHPARAVILHRDRRRPLVHPHAEPHRRLQQPDDELGRVDQPAGVLQPHAAPVDRRGDLRLHRRRVGEDLHVVAEPLVQRALLLEPRVLVRRDRRHQLAGELEVAVDPVATHVLHVAGEVLARQPLQQRHLVGEAGQPVLQPVGQRPDAEAAVAAAGPEAHRAALEQDDVARRVVGLGVQRRPQAGEAAADDAQVGVDHALQRWLRLPRRQRVEPVRAHDGVRVRGAVLRGRRRRPRLRRGRNRGQLSRLIITCLTRVYSSSAYADRSLP